MTDKTDTADDARVLVGHIAGPHGVRGDVLIKSYTDIPVDIGGYGALGTQDGKTLVIRKCRATSKGVVAFIDGVTSRTAAEALKGTKLYVGRDQLPETEDDEWYVADLIGLDVQDEAGRVIGSVITVHDFGAGELLELQVSGRAQTLLVPFTQELVPDVSVAKGFVRVDLTADLLDDDAESGMPGASDP